MSRSTLYCAGSRRSGPSWQMKPASTVDNPRPVPLSRAATEVLAIIAYKQPITRTGIEAIRGTTSDSALDTLLARGLVSLAAAHLFTTTRAFLHLASLRDLATFHCLSPTTTTRTEGRQPLASAAARTGHGRRYYGIESTNCIVMV